MALQKQIKTLQNQDANYWKITGRQYSDSYNGVSVIVTLSLFTDKESRMILAAPIDHMDRTYSFDGDLSKAELYTAIVQRDEFFSDAIQNA